jgi:sarcosine oxidase subunit gamma
MRRENECVRESQGIHVSAVQHRTIFQLSSWDGGARSTLPAGVGSVSPGDPRILCVKPREWLLISEDARGQQGNFSGCAFVNLSDALAVTRVAGSAAREVLAKGCGLDFDARAFVVDQCARTRFGQIAVVIDCRAPDQFDLYCGRSYQDYLSLWLREATLA